MSYQKFLAAKAHAELLAAVQLAFSKGDTRLLRAQAGMAWQGTVLEHTSTRLVLAYPRAVRLGPEGMSDLIGWTRDAKFVALEIKTGAGRATAEQLAFLNLVHEAGGYAGIVRSVEDAYRILCQEAQR